jgi:3-hydroxyacyl-[acyl-carrier-protein] dehydratase
MLQGDFFNVSSTTVTNRTVLVTIHINPSHRIFEGHFPGHPVVPGVCMMQMLKELLETVIEKETRLLKADHMKFLAIINPKENATIQAEFTYNINESGEYVVTARLFRDGLTFLKFKGLFAVREP